MADPIVIVVKVYVHGKCQITLKREFTKTLHHKLFHQTNSHRRMRGIPLRICHGSMVPKGNSTHISSVRDYVYGSSVRLCGPDMKLLGFQHNNY